MPTAQALSRFLETNNYFAARRHFRIGGNTIRSILRKAGIEPPSPYLVTAGKRGPKEAQYSTEDLVAFLDSGHGLREAMGYFRTSMTTIAPKLRDAGRVDLLDRRRKHNPDSVTDRTRKEYQSKSDRRPSWDAYKQPFRNPMCIHYDECLAPFVGFGSHTGSPKGMDCTGCERFALRELVDPVQTVGHHGLNHEIGRM